MRKKNNIHRIKKRITARIIATAIATGMILQPFSAVSIRAEEMDASKIVDDGESNTTSQTALDTKVNEDIIASYHGELDPKVTSVYDLPATYSSNQLTAQASVTLPESYKSDSITSVKNQNPYGTCWAHAVCAAAEANLVKKGLAGNTVDLSEFQLAYFINNKTVTDPLGGTVGDSFSVGTETVDYLTYGGNQILAVNKLASWTGYVDEADAPYTSVIGDRNAELDDKYAIIEDDYHLKNAYIINMQDRDVVKKLIMEMGACGAAYCTNSAYYNTSNIWYCSEEPAEYCPSDLSTNHAITIVGWDDTYSASNFGTYKPSSDGAWLVKNSWGTSWGKNGYFWISYEDVPLSTGVAFFYDVTTRDKDYDNNYQYDGGAWGKAYYKSYEANVYTAKGSESLKAVGFFTYDTGYSCEINIYKGCEYGKPTSGELVATKSVKADYEGFHTVVLDNEVLLDKDDVFSVVVKQVTGDGSLTIIDVDSTCSSSWYKNVSSAETGESFTSSSGYVWSDISANNENCRIKAFTDNVSGVAETDPKVPITSVSISEGETAITSKSLETGEIASFTAAVAPDNTTDSKQITWVSSDTAVATVTASGTNNASVTVKAVKAGAAIITATTSNGKTATVKVTVTEPKVPITSVSISEGETAITAKLLETGKIASFTAVVAPANTTDSKQITWASSDTAVATVTASGTNNASVTVTAVKAGAATITATTSNGKTATVNITVTTPTTAPGTTAPGTTAPGTTNPGTTNPGTTNPGTTAPGTTNPGTTNPGTTNPGTTNPGTTNPGTTNPATTVPDVTVSYRTHVQSFGWQNFVTNGTMSGTSGKAKRLEGIEIKVSGNQNLGIRYRTHVQTYGWQDWRYDGTMSGTSGESKRLEAIQIELTGADKDKYDIYYRVHAQSYGWLGWAKNGASAGTAAQAKRLEGIQIVVLKKGNTPSEGMVGYSFIGVGKSSTANPKDGLVNYMTHVQSYGDQKYVSDGSVSGTFGEAKRLEGIRINVNNEKLGLSGGITYQTHVQTYGWLNWSSNGDFNGTHGQAKRLEAIKIKLTGELANKYDVYYRVHSQTFGWLGWAKNGASAGTAGYAKRLEGIQIVLLPKESAAPSSNPGTAGMPAYISK